MGFKREKREKVLELSLFSCDFFFFVLRESRELAWEMGMLIKWLNHLRVILQVSMACI